ncbi:MAG: fumarase, partial [Mycobacterium sp.]|nr:fumarase [Mycobacterium sp.]
MNPSVRVERDFAGEVHVDTANLWGAQTQRALDAFTISDLRLPRTFIHILGSLKRAAALANN